MSIIVNGTEMTEPYLTVGGTKKQVDEIYANGTLVWQTRPSITINYSNGYITSAKVNTKLSESGEFKIMSLDFGHTWSGSGFDMQTESFVQVTSTPACRFSESSEAITNKIKGYSFGTGWTASCLCMNANATVHGIYNSQCGNSGGSSGYVWTSNFITTACEVPSGKYTTWSTINNKFLHWTYQHHASGPGVSRSVELSGNQTGKQEWNLASTHFIIQGPASNVFLQNAFEAKSGSFTFYGPPYGYDFTDNVGVQTGYNYTNHGEERFDGWTTY